MLYHYNECYITYLGSNKKLNVDKRLKANSQLNNYYYMFVLHFDKKIQNHKELNLLDILKSERKLQKQTNTKAKSLTQNIYDKSKCFQKRVFKNDC